MKTKQGVRPIDMSDRALVANLLEEFRLCIGKKGEEYRVQLRKKEALQRELMKRLRGKKTRKEEIDPVPLLKQIQAIRGAALMIRDNFEDCQDEGSAINKTAFEESVKILEAVREVQNLTRKEK